MSNVEVVLPLDQVVSDLVLVDPDGVQHPIVGSFKITMGFGGRARCEPPLQPGQKVVYVPTGRAIYVQQAAPEMKPCAACDAKSRAAGSVESDDV